LAKDYGSEADPQNMNSYSTLDHWPDKKLSSRAAEHSYALRGPNSGGEIAGGKSSRRKINCASEGERRAGPLQQSPNIPCNYRRDAEQQTADSKNRDSDGNRAFRSQMV
jgi:hypothetical protein